ncbi:MAG: leucine-rich repeat protein, partial [Oscillospiraceae bacterium]|nr:leucine-rich repeat protein [Oscillospiraceae bacterium]
MKMKKKIAFILCLALLSSAAAAATAQIPLGFGNGLLTSWNVSAASGTCGDSLSWSLVDGVLTISGSGEMTEYDDQTDAPWYSDRNSVTSIVIGKDVTKIASDIFASYPNIVSYSVEAGNTSYASESGVLYNADKTVLYYFPQANTAENFTIPSTVKELGNYAFFNTNIASVYVPASVSKVGHNAFAGGCTSNLYFSTIPSYIGKDGYGVGTTFYLNNVLSEKDYTLSDYFEMSNATVTSTSESVSNVFLHFTLYGSNTVSSKYNKGDTVHIRSDMYEYYSPTGKVFYAVIGSGGKTTGGHMLYLPDTLSYPEDFDAEWFSINPYLVIEHSATAPLEVAVYERIGVNQLLKIGSTTSLTYNLGEADDAALHNRLDGKEFVMFEGESWTIPEILGKSGIGHIASCLAGEHVYNSSISSQTPAIAGEDVINFEVGDYEHRVTALNGGTAKVKFDAHTERCVFHYTATATDNILTIRVIEKPAVTSTETTIVFDKLEGYEYYLMGSIEPNEVTADKVIFSGLTPGKSYPFLLKTTTGYAQTSFEVSTIQHEELLRVDVSDKSKAEILCTNEELLGEINCTYEEATIQIVEDFCGSPAKIIKSENFPAHAVVSEIAYTNTVGIPVPADELGNGTYIAYATVTYGDMTVTIKKEITVTHHFIEEWQNDEDYHWHVCDNEREGEVCGFITDHEHHINKNGDEVELLACKICGTEYTVTVGGTNVVPQAPADVLHGEEYTTTLVPEEDCRLPEEIVVTVNGTPTEDYTYNQSTGEVTLTNGVTGDVVITADCVKQYDVITKGEGLENYDDVTLDVNSDYSTTLQPGEDYRLPEEIVVTVNG